MLAEFRQSGTVRNTPFLKLDKKHPCHSPEKETELRTDRGGNRGGCVYLPAIF